MKPYTIKVLPPTDATSRCPVIQVSCVVPQQFIGPLIIKVNRHNNEMVEPTYMYNDDDKPVQTKGKTLGKEIEANDLVLGDWCLCEGWHPFNGVYVGSLTIQPRQNLSQRSALMFMSLEDWERREVDRKYPEMLQCMWCWAKDGTGNDDVCYSFKWLANVNNMSSEGRMSEHQKALMISAGLAS
jgi:hypothetical protein